MTLEERFWEKVDKIDSYWNWKASKHRGYGQFKVHRKMQRAHRFSWELHNGPIPNNLLVCHRCDNPSCVNPNHLFLGTYKDNNNDRDRKGRQSNRDGENCGQAKLTEKQVLEIRHIYSLGNITQDKLAKQFNISQSQIDRIIRKIRWKHI